MTWRRKRCVAYCVMCNHFNVLVEVPWREVWLWRFDGPEGEKKLLEHLRTLYSKSFVGLLKDELDDLRRRGMTTLAEEKVEAIKKRFCDLSGYVKEVKERFSRWFNIRRGRKGTLWMDRFKSVQHREKFGRSGRLGRDGSPRAQAVCLLCEGCESSRWGELESVACLRKLTPASR